MKITRAILATNDNEQYYQFWPLVARRWQRWGIIPTLIVISDKKLDIDESLGDVIYYSPLEKQNTAHQAQVIRLFAAANFESDVCLVSDLDMMPLKKEYFTDAASYYDDEHFLVYSSDAYLPGDPAFPAYPMCYLCSKGINFKNIIEGNLSNFEDKFGEWMNYGYGWHTDEKVFYKKFQEWAPNHKKVTFLRRGFNISNSLLSIARIDRSNGCEHNKNLISQNFYVDFHMPRPYKQHSEIIDFIYSQTDLKETNEQNEK